MAAAERDPMLVARSLSCRWCEAERYPVRAAWISEQLLLAEYEPSGYPCRHPGLVVLVDLDAESETVPEVIRPRLCRAIAATTGRQCQKPAGRGSAYCHQHAPDWQEAR
jgi:hypothetical protein